MKVNGALTLLSRFFKICVLSILALVALLIVALPVYIAYQMGPVRIAFEVYRLAVIEPLIKEKGLHDPETLQVCDRAAEMVQKRVPPASDEKFIEYWKLNRADFERLAAQNSRRSNGVDPTDDSLGKWPAHLLYFQRHEKQHLGPPVDWVMTQDYDAFERFCYSGRWGSSPCLNKAPGSVEFMLDDTFNPYRHTVCDGLSSPFKSLLYFEGGNPPEVANQTIAGFFDVVGNRLPWRLKVEASLNNINVMRTPESSLDPDVSGRRVLQLNERWFVLLRPAQEYRR